MSRSVCSRVACLRIPRFPIAVVQKTDRAQASLPMALTRGRGNQARILLVSQEGERAGLEVGWKPAQARSLVPTAYLIPWDPSLDALLGRTMDDLARRLQQVSPRCQVASHGAFWLEPFSPGGLQNPRHHPSGEFAFSTQVIQLMASSGFEGARVGLADQAVTAAAASRWGTAPIFRVAPGRDAAFLRDLPLEALPIGLRTRRRLAEVGITRIASLQEMPAEALVSRFGPEGRHLWSLAHGQDPRGPRSPRPRLLSRVEIPLDGPCEELEPLIFVLRSTIDSMVEAMAPWGRVVTRWKITLQRDRGDPIPVIFRPACPTNDGAWLLRLLRLRLQDAFAAITQEEDAVQSVLVEALDSRPQTARQGDLFEASWTDPMAMETAWLQLVRRLGERSVGVPVRTGERHPERVGDWQEFSLHLPHPSPPPSASPPTPRIACLQRLDPASPASRHPDGKWTFDLHGADPAQVAHWYGPEHLSGHWWGEAYDRDYYWAITEDHRVLRLYQDRLRGGWFLEGWLD